MLSLAHAKDRSTLHYDLVDSLTGLCYLCPGNTGWRYSRETMGKKLAEGRIIFPKKPIGRPMEKLSLDELRGAMIGFHSVINRIFTADDSQAVRNIFGQQNFAFPKTPDLVQRLIVQMSEDNSLILHSFASSGSTAHAVLKQSAEDGDSRRLIIVEIDDGIARNVTAKCMRRVTTGYANAKGQAVEGLGGGLQFRRLSAEPLFTTDGQISADVRFAQLAEFVCFAETGSGYAGCGDSPLLGVHDGRAIYLLYKGIFRGESVGGGNVLTAFGPRHSAVFRPENDLRRRQPPRHARRVRGNHLQANALRAGGVIMETQPRVIIIAGPNGACKTTFILASFCPTRGDCPVFVNAELIAAGLAPFAPEVAAVRAGHLVLEELHRHFAARASFAFETTLSGRGYLRWIRQWQDAGYYVELIFLRLDSPERAIKRVQQRVREDGDEVPVDVIRRRFAAVQENFDLRYAAAVDSWAEYDNSGIPSLLLDWSEKPWTPDRSMKQKAPTCVAPFRRSSVRRNAPASWPRA